MHIHAIFLHNNSAPETFENQYISRGYQIF